jgi:hypothetical protein
MKHNRLELFLEFLVFGIAMGITEDLIAVYLITGGPISLEMVWIAAAVAIPFAALGELVVDRLEFPKKKK